MDHLVRAAVVTMKADETSGQNSAVEVGPKLLFNEARHTDAIVGLGSSGEEGLEVCLKHLVKDAALRISPLVGGGRPATGHATLVQCGTCHAPTQPLKPCQLGGAGISGTCAARWTV